VTERHPVDYLASRRLSLASTRYDQCGAGCVNAWHPALIAFVAARNWQTLPL